MRRAATLSDPVRGRNPCLDRDQPLHRLRRPGVLRGTEAKRYPLWDMTNVSESSCTQASEILRRLPMYSRTIRPARSRLSSELRRAARVAPHDSAKLSSLSPTCGSSRSTAIIEARRSPLRSARLRYPALFSIIQREGRSASFLSRNVRAQSFHRFEIGDAYRSARR